MDLNVEVTTIVIERVRQLQLIDAFMLLKLQTFTKVLLLHEFHL